MLPLRVKEELKDYLDSLVSRSKSAPSNSKKNHPKAGCMKGTFTLLPGFDEPLDDFKEYME